MLNEARPSARLLVVDGESLPSDDLARLMSLGHVLRRVDVTAIEADPETYLSAADVLVLDAGVGLSAENLAVWMQDVAKAPALVLVGPAAAAAADPGLQALCRFDVTEPVDSPDARTRTTVRLAQAIEEILGISEPEGGVVERTPSRATAIRLEQFLERAGGDEYLMRELATMFLDDAERRLSALEDAIQREDWPTLTQGAHRIKGALGMLAAEPAYEAALALEAAARRGVGAELVPALATLRAQVERVLIDLGEIVNQPVPKG